MVSFYLLCCFGYPLLHGWLANKWPSNPPVVFSENFSIKTTLVIPFRNELSNLEQLVNELKKLVNQVGEILLVDDRSEDGSVDALSGLLFGMDGVSILRSPGDGKKAALTFGISKAKGEIILTSDADCQFPENWARILTSPFDSPEVCLVAGPVVTKVRIPGFLHKFQQIEWFSILLLTQFSFARKQPLTCSGANLAFRKSTFLELNGYSGNERILSGDDEFLLKKIVRKFGIGSCKYLPTREVLVLTSSQSAWADFFSQRVRWAGKWKAHRSFFHVFSAIGVFFFQWVWIYIFFKGFQNQDKLALLCLVGAVKFISEYSSLGKVGYSLGFQRKGWEFLLTSLAHPFYVVIVGLGTFFFRVRWKGRTQ